MKKTFILSFLFVAISISLTAQIKKGSTLLGVDFGFSGSDFKQAYIGSEIKNSSAGFNASLLYGKAVKDNLFAGGSISFSSSTYKQGSPEIKQNNKIYGASVWTRKYFPVYGSLYAFVNGSLYANIGANENPNNNPRKTTSFGLGVSLDPGISLQLKKSFYLDASLNNLANIYYTHTKGIAPDGAGNTVTVTSNNYRFSTSLGNSSNPLQLGIRWIIPGKK